MSYKSKNVGSGFFQKQQATKLRTDALAAWIGPLEENTKLIPLGRNNFAKVDALYFELFMRWNWGTSGKNYVTRSEWENGLDRQISMHCVLCDNSKGTVDHINRDTLDNRRHNLRPATYSQNTAYSCRTKTGVSKYRGVWWDSKRKRFRVTVRENGKRTILGYFQSEQRAAIVFNDWAIKYHGEFAVLNHVL